MKVNGWNIVISQEKDKITGFICDNCGKLKETKFKGSITGLCVNCANAVKEDMIEQPDDYVPQGDFEF